MPTEVKLNVQLDDAELCDIAFVCPPKQIMIDDQMRTMRYDLPVPCIEIDGAFNVIRFLGPPREIFIDDVAFVVPFDRSVRVKLKGRPHELAWGGPGFEVIIDGRSYELPFTQSMDVPPREIYIGGQQHTIRIMGDAPDVRICGRLPDEILQVHEQQPHDEHEIEAQPAPLVEAQLEKPVETKPELNVGDILNRLKDYNLLPITSVPDLTTFDMSLLKQKYDQAVQNLYGGVQCASCGMRFVNQKSNRYSKHLDWHFRQNKKDKEEINVAHSRAWFYTWSDWIQYEELSEETPVNGTESGDAKASASPEASASANDGASISNRAGADANMSISKVESTCTATDDNFCFVCKESFDSYWDEEKDEWRFKDAYQVGNRVYHTICYEDVQEENSIMENTSRDLSSTQLNNTGLSDN